jgi:tRNA U38,U39,U40 pseudouridine synthase TruA
MSLHDRTDRGVHALRSSAHVDLERYSGLEYDPAHLTVAYNQYFTKANLDLR